jgi:hypothetical protein
MVGGLPVTHLSDWKQSQELCYNTIEITASDCRSPLDKCEQCLKQGVSLSNGTQF